MLMRLPIIWLSLPSPARAFPLSAFVSGNRFAAVVVPAASRQSTVYSLDSKRGRMSPLSGSSSSSPGLTDLGSSKSVPEEIERDVVCWRDRIDASIVQSRKIRGGNFVQIATVDPATQAPRCRTVVFRGFLPLGGSNKDAMKMITDSRSSKVSEVSVTNGGNGMAEMVWWFSKSNEQYRIRGTLEFVGQDHCSQEMIQARKQQWGSMSDSAREQFYWKDPGVPYEPQNVVPVGGRDESSGKVLPPPDNFLLMLLRPFRVDYLRLGDNFRQIDELIDGSDQWTLNRVNP